MRSAIGAWRGTGQDRRPGVGEAEGGGLEIDVGAPRLQAQQLEPLAQAGPIGCLDEEHGVDEVDPTLAGVDPPPAGDRGGAEPLALDVGELAPLGRQPLGGADLAQAGW